MAFMAIPALGMTAAETMGAIGAVAAVAGAGMSAYGQIQAGQTASKVADYNAQVQTEQAQVAIENSQSQAQQIAQQTKAKLGSVAAAFGAGGVDMTGTPLSVMSNLSSQGELSRQLTLYQGTITAEGLNSSAALQRAEGTAQASAGVGAAFGTILSGASSAAKNLQPYFGTSSSPLAPQYLPLSQNPSGQGASPAGGLT